MTAFSLAISVSYVPPTYHGGGETYIYYLTKELVKLGISIDLFAAEIPKKAEKWNWDHVSLHECKPLFMVRHNPIMPSLPLSMIKNGRYDLVHTGIPLGFACDAATFVSHIKRKPLILTYHCDVVSSTSISGAYASFLKLYTLRCADKILPTTRSYADTSPLLKNFRDKVEVIPMGVDLARYTFNKQHRDEIRAKHGIRHDEKVILFVGGLNYYRRYKRIDLLIKAMEIVLRYHENVTLIIVGEGDLRPSLENLCRELNLRKVIFTGYLSEQDLPKYYCAADLFVLASLVREEAFGIVLLEAAACGVVPISFGIPGPSEVCQDLGGFVAPVPTTEELHVRLAETILEALTTDLESKSKVCMENVKRYDWSKIAERTLRVYQELV